MFTEKLENILKLVEFLHSNIDNFSQYDANFEEIQKLDEVRKQLNPDNSFKEQQQYNEVMKNRGKQFEIVNKNVITPIVNKHNIELNIQMNFGFDSSDKKDNKNIDETDFQRLNECKNKFLEYRKTKNTPIYLNSQIGVINDLDQFFPEIIRYFIGDENNEFDFLKPKPKPIKEKQNTVECSEPHQYITPTAKGMPNIENKSIVFKDKEIIEKIFELLKGYFPDNEKQLFEVLEGNKNENYLYFPHNANKLVEFFGRVKYNGYILSEKTEIKEWICSNFVYKNKNNPTPQKFLKSTVWNILSKRKGEAAKYERICIVEWLPFIHPETIKKEKEKEKTNQ